MNMFATIYKNEETVKHFLSLSIGWCVALSVLFLVLLYMRRFKKIFDEKLLNRHIPIVDNIIFPLLFSNKPVSEIIASQDYRKYGKKKKFRKVLLLSIIKLHTNYSGDYNLKLEELYRESGLINISLAKLKSESWNIICEGIRELSEMNGDESYTDMLALIQHEENTLKLEALIGIIRLKGIVGLTVLKDYQKPINDWIQLNLIYEINNAKIPSAYNFSEFLASGNDSLVIFGLRLISNFNQVHHIDYVRVILDSHNSVRVKQEAEKTINKLSSLNFNY